MIDEETEEAAATTAAEQEQFTDRNQQQQPLLSFALLTDIQYADCEDGQNFDKSRNRYYRNSINLVREAVTNWRSYEMKSGQKLRFLLQLGDIIDAKSKQNNAEHEALDLVLGELNKLDTRILHIVGNHEMYNFKRSELVNLPLNTAKHLGYMDKKIYSKANYFTYEISDRLRLIALDFYEFSAIGYDETDETYLQALEMLKMHNKNANLNSIEGMRGHSQRYTLFNGSPSQSQMSWLNEKLNECKSTGKKAIVCGHLPVHPQSAAAMNLAWNSKEMLDVLGSFEGTVVAYFAGHDHMGGYFRDKHNIHHITFAAILETPRNSNAYATVKIYDDDDRKLILVEGVGMIGYYEINY